MGLDQIGITLSGVIAVWLTQDKRATCRRLACVFGMFAQPFWFYAAWKAEQWGIFAMCTLYTYAWARGIWIHWIYPFLASCQVRTAEIRHQPPRRLSSQYHEDEVGPGARPF
jgi:hypothetical protein